MKDKDFDHSKASLIKRYVYGKYVDIENVFRGLSRILIGEEYPHINLERFRKIWIWTFGWLLHQINFLYEAVKLKQSSYWQNPVLCDRSISYFQLKNGTSIFWKKLSFLRKFVSKLKYWKRSKFPQRAVPFIRRMLALSAGFEVKPQLKHTYI